MVRNERGFIYPLTFCILMIISLFLIILAQQFVSDKKVFMETELILQQDYYLMRTVKNIEKQLAEDNLLVLDGTYKYSHGVVTYRIESLTNSLLQVNVQLIQQDNVKISGYSYYDVDLKKMIKWVEKN